MVKKKIRKYSKKKVFSSDGQLLPLEERTFITTEGYNCVLTDCGEKVGHVTCVIGKHEFQAQFQNVKIGKIKNPYHLSICNIGYKGVGKYERSLSPDSYKAWVYLINKIYKPDFKAYLKGYKITKKWHNFQIFSKYFYTNYKGGYVLVIDDEKKKTYSPSNCSFIPLEINKFLYNSRANNKSGYTGVSFQKVVNRWRVMISYQNKNKFIGYFDNVGDANVAYKEAKAKYLQELIKKYDM